MYINNTFGDGGHNIIKQTIYTLINSIVNRMLHSIYLVEYFRNCYCRH